MLDWGSIPLLYIISTSLHLDNNKGSSKNKIIINITLHYTLTLGQYHITNHHLHIHILNSFFYIIKNYHECAIYSLYLMAPINYRDIIILLCTFFNVMYNACTSNSSSPILLKPDPNRSLCNMGMFNFLYWFLEHFMLLP